MKDVTCVCTYLHSTVGLEGGSMSSCNLNVIFCPLAHGGLYASFDGSKKDKSIIIYIYIYIEISSVCLDIYP